MTNPDPFETLGLDRRFDMPRAEIERAYLARIAGTHPDVDDGGTGSSAALNGARDTLLDDEARARVLLAGLDPDGEHKYDTLPDGFLMQTLAWREGVLDADTRAAVLAELAEARAEILGEVSALLADTAEADPGRLRALYAAMNAWRFIERLREQAPE